MSCGTWSSYRGSRVWINLGNCSSRNQCWRISGSRLPYANVVVRNQVRTLPVDRRIPREQLSISDACCVRNTVTGLALLNDSHRASLRKTKRLTRYHRSTTL